MKKSNIKKIIIIVLVLAITGLTWQVANTEEGAEEPVINERGVNSNTDTIENYYLLERKKGVSIPEIKAEAAYSVYLKDDERQVLFSRGRNERLPIASITKLMTALVVYENYDLSESIGIPDSEFFTDSHLSDLKVFTDTTFGELLYPLLLESNNSGAYAAATAPEEVDFDDFIQMMNSTADKLGMRRTVYYNPSGLDTIKGVNLSTARDVSMLIERLLDVDIFWDIMEKTRYDIHSHRADLYYRITTTNRFLDGTYFNIRPDWHSEIIGGKTGFTYEAMGCLVMVLEVDGGYMINVILGADGRLERFQEMEKLINWTHKAYEI